MTRFELTRLACEPFLIPLHKQVRRRLVDFARTRHGQARILDVGGRKSPYTIAVPAHIHITDIERRSEVQTRLNLGINSSTVRQTANRRSNVEWILFDDMTSSSLKAGTFDCVVAVEVLEHVEQDREFVHEVYRILKPGGFFLMTTPNGDFVENHNSDHKRHYRREQLKGLLESRFDEVDVHYAIKSSRFRRWGLRAWSIKRPGRTLLGMVSNWINSIESAAPSLSSSASGTHHLMATARKAAS